jgi:hypothetical protein
MIELIKKNCKGKILSLFVALFLLLKGCNFTPGTPVPPPPRENFSIMVASEPDCRGIWLVEVRAIQGTFKPDEFGLFTNLVTREGILTPANPDGSIRALVPADRNQNIAIRRRTVNGEESMPIVCMNPPPFDTDCVEPP